MASVKGSAKKRGRRVIEYAPRVTNALLPRNTGVARYINQSANGWEAR